jgi:hypothetical protein
MFRKTRSRLALSLVAATAFGTMGSLALSGMASAHDDPPPPPPGTPVDTGGDATYLVAALNGRNEVPGPAGSPAVGDKDGQAVEVLRIKGNQVSFAMKWNGIAAPTAGHIHVGATGINGAVKIPFFGTALPGTLNAAVGTVTVTEPGLLDSIKSNPGGFYANIHTGEFAGGAVRGQLHKVTHPVDLNSFLRGGPLTAVLDGNQEVQDPAGKPAGDADGHAIAFVRANRDQVNFAFSWNGIGAPTDGHIHQAATGTNGPVVVPLFSAPGGLPASITGVAGIAGNVKPDLARKISKDPASFYANLHTAEFAGGAVRGQLFRSGGDAGAFDSSSFVASVVNGEQIYACTKQADGTFAFTQHNVRARLQGGIQHSFVKDDAGPPQWVARDRSAVTGTLVSKTPNGAANIAELDLNLTQEGASTGQFANAVEVERLNTVGGVAPTGTCDPKKQPIANVPYQADYLFITK